MGPARLSFVGRSGGVWVARDLFGYTRNPARISRVRNRAPAGGTHLFGCGTERGTVLWGSIVGSAAIAAILALGYCLGRRDDPSPAVMGGFTVASEGNAHDHHLEAALGLAPDRRPDRRYRRRHGSVGWFGARPAGS